MVAAKDGVAFPMTDLLATLNVFRALAQGPAVGDLPSEVSTTAEDLTLLLLVAQAFPQGAALGLIGVDMLVRRLVADYQTTRELLEAKLQSQEGIGLFLHPGCHRIQIATLLGVFSRQFTGLIRTVAPRVRNAAYRGVATPDQGVALYYDVLSFHRAGNLLSFNLTEVFVTHRATSTYRSGNFEC